MTRGALQAVPMASIIHLQPGIGHEDPEASRPPEGGASESTGDGKKRSATICGVEDTSVALTISSAISAG